MSLIPVDKIRSTAEKAFIQAGVSPSFAAVQADLLIEAELRGHASHGLLRLPRLVARIKAGVADPAATGQQSWRGSAFLSVEGQNGLGPVVAMSALDALCDRVSETGVALSAIRNCNHLGMLAWYARKIAERGKVLIALTTSEALVHPWGGRYAMIGTNPIAIGVPADPQPFVMDMATSQVSMGKLHDYANRGKSIPEGWALDEAGNTTTDAAAATKGSIAPFGGPKGYALGLGFEVLVGVLTASALGTDVEGTLDDDMVCNKGDIFIVMEPASRDFASISAYLDTIRNMPAADPDRPVAIPGDRAGAEYNRCLETGHEPDPEIWRTICALANDTVTEF
ncbi:Ldh family oxidoreductase [Halomonas sp. MCCC 1A11036]|uniref:Ldh family oxidoreductase n=1 Tax=Billgrantia zhangzhouensis TaxID=2733481 RepID=A0ABS9A9H5_9GAMM|nr:Ldh family oxidoreductase [Halomonas zhangzhouensis]MCE8018572.1 Ldh family oxidoreductase [Halomonas zhangzhouensis]